MINKTKKWLYSHRPVTNDEMVEIYKLVYECDREYEYDHRESYA